MLSKIISIKKIENNSLKYNIETKAHNYFANNILIHNCDGSSATFIYYNNKFIISSRNVKQYSQPIKKAIKELHPGNASTIGKNSKFVEIACIYNIPKHLEEYAKKLNKNCLTIQGELCGPAIQGNKLNLKTNHLFIFNLFDPLTRNYYNWDFIEDFCKISTIPSVPLKERTFFKWANVKEMEDYVKESFNGSLYPKNTPKEGLIFRRYHPNEDFLPVAEKNQNGCFSWKCIDPSYIV